MVARVLGNMSFLMARADNPILVDLFLEKSIEVSREAHDPLTLAVGLTNMSSGVVGADVPRALTLLDEAVESTRRLGNVEWISLAHANRTLAQYLLGRWDDVEAAPSYELVQPDHAAMVVVLAALVRLARGHDPAPTLADKGELRQQTSEYWHLGDVLGLWAEHDPSTLERLRQVVEETQQVAGIGDDFHVTYSLAAEIAIELDDRPLIDRLKEILDESTTPPREGLRGHRALLGALDAARRGTVDEPADEPDELFRTAIASYDAWGSPVYAARARAAYGGWLAERGRADEAQDLLDTARATFAELGATTWLAALDGRPAGSVSVVSAT
jgi:hypothetical protein